MACVRCRCSHMHRANKKAVTIGAGPWAGQDMGWFLLGVHIGCMHGFPILWFSSACHGNSCSILHRINGLINHGCSSHDLQIPFNKHLPDRFCTKCWIKTKAWVLKSIKFQNGSISHLHPEVCPSWENEAEEPTKEQIRLCATVLCSTLYLSLLRACQYSFFLYPQIWCCLQESTAFISSLQCGFGSIQSCNATYE